MAKVISLLLVSLLLLSSVYAQSLTSAGGIAIDTGDVVITNVRQPNVIEQFLSLFTVYGLKSSYNIGDTLSITLYQMKINQDCTGGNAQIAFEVYTAPVGQHTATNNIYYTTKLLNNGAPILAGSTWFADFSFKIPGDKGTGTWSMSGYILCPQFNPANANTYQTPDEKNFGVVSPPPPTVCGNGVVESGENCDGGTKQCTTNGYIGSQSCKTDCSGYTSCTATQSCGDNLINGNEVCDGNTQACVVNGYSGSQTCSNTCSGYNSCTTTLKCGDGVVNGNEVCDGGSIACPSGQTGTQSCKLDCSGYSSSQCTTIIEESTTETEESTTETEESTTTCTPSWSTGSWSACSVNGVQTRTVTDSNNCGVNTNKPVESRSCIYVAPSEQTPTTQSGTTTSTGVPAQKSNNAFIYLILVIGVVYVLNRKKVTIQHRKV